MSLCLSVFTTATIQAGPLGPSTQLPAPDRAAPEAFALPQGTTIPLPEKITLSQRKPLLKKLYRRLREAPTPDRARPIEEAIEQVWLTSGDDNIDFIMQNAITAMEENDMVVARELLQRVTELRPAYAEGWNKRAMVHFMQKDYEKALHLLRRALALDPHHFQALHGLALVLQEIGDERGSLQAYRVLLRNHPQFSDAKEAVDELNRHVNGQGT